MATRGECPGFHWAGPGWLRCTPGPDESRACKCPHTARSHPRGAEGAVPETPRPPSGPRQNLCSPGLCLDNFERADSHPGAHPQKHRPGRVEKRAGCPRRATGAEEGEARAGCCSRRGAVGCRSRRCAGGQGSHRRGAGGLPARGGAAACQVPGCHPSDRIPRGAGDAPDRAPAPYALVARVPCRRRGLRFPAVHASLRSHRVRDSGALPGAVSFPAAACHRYARRLRIVWRSLFRRAVLWSRGGGPRWSWA